MIGSRFRSPGVALSAIVAVAVAGVASTVMPASAMAEVALLAGNTAWVMGQSSAPIASDPYVDAVNQLYIEPNYPGFTPTPLFTPEGLYPLSGIKDLTLDESVSRGVTILDDAITPITAQSPENLVFGYSQSAIISSLEMQQLDPSGTPSDLPLTFVMIGNPMNPNGGLLERFDGLSLPALGLTFSGATPANDFPTTIYTAEYDIFADYPRYPLDVLSDLNAIFGSVEHGSYPNLTPAQVGSAISLPTEGDTLTHYYMIPTENLPLLDLLRAVPVVGNPLADLLQPDLTYLVNLGYGDPLYGYSTGPANVPTPFGLLPPASAFDQLPKLLLDGAEQGVQDFIGDLTGTGPNPVTLPSFASLLDTSSALSDIASDPATSLTDILNALSSAASSAYAVLLPTADIANAFLTSIPAYDASLFAAGIEAGNLLEAVGDPVAADMGLVTIAGGFELLVVEAAVQAIVGDLAGLIP